MAGGAVQIELHFAQHLGGHRRVAAAVLVGQLQEHAQRPQVERNRVAHRLSAALSSFRDSIMVVVVGG